MSYNRVLLLGNLGADPEMRTAGNTVVTSARIATNETYTDKNGNKQTVTEWHDVEFWGKQAELAHNYLKKGNAVFIEGRIKSDTWEDKEGNKRKTIRIRVINFNFIDRNDSQERSEQTHASNDSISHSSTNTFKEDDDLPF